MRPAEIATPLQIGSVTLPSRILCGPMAGVSDLSFRLLCMEMGAGLAVTELISAKAITYHNVKTREMLRTDPAEHPVAVQLFGSDPEVFAQAAAQIEDESFELLDVNMGCPVHKVFQNGEGAALMRDPGRIEAIVRALTSVSSRPVTVKMRAGTDAAHINAVACALAAERGGARMITVHARTRDQFYEGRADWSVIRAVREAVSVPVIGNGDVTDPESAAAMIETTGCDGIMVARASQGNPWIFRDILTTLTTGTRPPTPTGAERLAMLRRHIDRMRAACGDFVTVREMRRHVASYSAGLPHAARLRARVNTITTVDELLSVCASFFTP